MLGVMMNHMRALMLLAISISSVYGCSCREPTVPQALGRAEVVFRGTIIALRDAGKDYDSGFVRYIGKTVVFRVDRVWKGEVGQTFEMPGYEETSACIGFWPDFL